MVKSYYIYGCSVYYIYGQILLHLWFVDLLHLWLKVITFMVSITFMVNFYYIYGWYYIYGFYYIYGWYSCNASWKLKKTSNGTQNEKPFTYTSWSALLYIRAFWNINIMSLWNSLVVRMVWNNRMVQLLYLKVNRVYLKRTYSDWKFTGRSLPHFQCSFLLSKDP